MKRVCVVAVIVVATAASACSSRVARESTGDIDIGASTTRPEDWGGEVRGVEGWSRMRGSAYALQNEKGTIVTLTLDRGVAGAVYGWEVLEGQCGSTGRAVDQPSVFPPLYIEDSGHGAAIATLKTRLTPRTEYFINVYGAVEPRGNVVACGKLAE